MRVTEVDRGQEARRIAVRGHDDPHHVRPALRGEREELDPSHPRHSLVREDDGDGRGAQDLDRFVRMRGGGHREGRLELEPE